MSVNLKYQEVNSSNLFWKHFLKSVDGNSAKCKLCPAILKISARSTKGLHTHIRTKHNSVNVQVTARIAAPNIQTSPTPSTSTSSTAIVNLDDIDDSAPTQSVLPKKRKITEFFASENKVPVAERVSRMVAKDGIPVSKFITSTDLRELFQMDGIKLPSSASTIQNMVMAYGTKIKMETIEELEALKNYQHRFTITFDEWCSSRNRRYLNLNLHLYRTGSVKIWNLGLVRVLGSFPAEACVSALEKKLREFKIDLARDIIVATTDGAAVMQKVGRLLSAHHQLCFAHGLQLAVLDVLYKNEPEAEEQVQVAIVEQNKPDSDSENEDTQGDFDIEERLPVADLLPQYRASNGSNNRLSTDTTPISGDIILEKSRITPSPHQIHPVCDEKAQLLAYENNIKSRDKPTSLIFPQTTTSSTLYPLTPNICVEGGRIEFIKTTPDGDTTPSSLQNVETTLASETPPVPPPRYSATSMCNGTSPQSIVSSQRHSAVSVDIKPEVMSRGLQVDFSDHFYDEKICGLALVTVGIIFLVQINSADKIFEGYDLSVAPILFIIIGAAIFLIAFFGCYGAMRQNGCMLKTYAIILCVILVVELVTCYFAFKVLNDSAFKDNVSKELKNYVDSYFKVENNTTRDTVDTIQKFFECCGVDGPADYENVNNNPDKELPRTCCDYAIDSGKKCFMPQVQYKDGCINILTGTIDSITRTLGIFGIIVALILECLEQRVLELELALEQEHKANHKDRMAITKLQRQLARRESVQRDAERERKLRAESEVRVREAGAEATRYRTRLKYLTQEFSKMEESVRAMLAYKSRAEQLKQEKATLTLNFETKSQQYQQTINRLTEEIASLHQQLESNPPEISALEAENESLKEQVKEAHLQYEKCLDDVANQVVRALLSQKTLREEICVLTRRIEELENQNRALTSLLVQQLRSGNTSAMITPTSAREQLALEEEILNDITASLSSSSIFNTPDEEPRLRHSNSFDFDPRRHIDKRFSAGDLISSYNERVLPNGELVACISEKRLSANVLDDCTDNSLSLDDKKRHQVLADLWKELQGSEVTPQKLLNALSALESTLWTGTNSNAKRPATLDLALPNFQPARPVQRRTRPVIVPVIKPEEEAGSESPESGNRDEGYSTMSSDVQCDVNRSHSEPNRNLEDLAEATDETADSENRFIVVEDHDPDILYIPINLALRLNPRNSYPPSKDLLPFQHVMRSFSDSHLCIKITTAPSPCYSISSPISTPSVVLLDMNPLRRVRGNITLEDSWGSNLDAEWDTEYIQHWLKLDEKRLNLQQQHRDLLELEYDKAELEDWSLSLSANDAEIVTPVSVATLPSIQEGSVIELEEDVSECLWNDSSYLDRTREIEISWPYTADSPPESWSSVSEDEPCSKRSSAALSGCSDEPPAINFTRDFYRLVKFESTKSLASCSSSRGPGQKDQNHPDREQTLQNVLNFIAEQQMYCNRQDSRPSSARDFNNEAPQPQSRLDDLVWTDSFTSTESDHELYLKNELALNEQNTLKDLIPDCIVSAVENDNIESQPDVVTEVAQPRLITVPEEEETTPPTTLTESFTSTVSTPDTIVSRIPRPKSQTSSPKTTPKPKVEAPKKVIKSKIPYKHKSTVVHLVRQETQPVITSERLPQFASSVPPCSVIEGPPDRAVSFHERATSKDVIDELNRMIRKDEDTRNEVEEVKTLDSCCYPTGWVHVEKDIDFNDPKARANLLDVMLASSDSSPTSSCGGSVSSESTEDRNDYKRLHKIHRYRRQKKASALRHITSTDASTTALQTMAKIITSNTATYQMRPSIIGRNHFYVRYGDKEKEAVASFDFLQNYSTLKSCKE